MITQTLPLPLLLQELASLGDYRVLNLTSIPPSLLSSIKITSVSWEEKTFLIRNSFPQSIAKYFRILLESSSSPHRPCVIYVDNALAAKDSPVLLKDRNEIRFCKGHFIYQLEKQIFKEEEEEEEGQEEEHNVTIELSAVTHENEMRERMEMALEDLDAMIRARHLRDLNNTQATCRKLLSSFYCDICIEVIASCRSCVPCGHNYCFPCITQYMAVSKK
jgi:hypothetical protein